MDKVRSLRVELQVYCEHLTGLNQLIIDELGFVSLSPTGAELLFEVFSQRYERGSILVTTNLPCDEWTEVFGSERLTQALLDRLIDHVHILCKTTKELKEYCGPLMSERYPNTNWPLSGHVITNEHTQPGSEIWERRT